MRQALQTPTANVRGLLAFVLVFSGLFAAVPLRNAIRQPDYNKDYSLWYGIGQEVRAGRPLYVVGRNGEVLYMYPPTPAVLIFAPLTILGPVGFVAVLALGTALAWAGSLVLALQLATGRADGLPRWYVVLAFASIGPYVYDLFLLGQVNVFLLLLVLGAERLLAQHRAGSAGALLGLAIAIKVFPLPILVYWAVRREWRAALAAALAVVVLVVVLPGAVRGFERNAEELREWARLMTGDQTGQAMAARSSVGFTRRNQSLIALSHRLTRDVEAGDRDGVHVMVNVLNLAPRTAQYLGFAAVLALGAIFLLATRLRFAETPAARAEEIAMVLVLAVLASPLAWTYFFCWLLPAWAIVLDRGRTRREIIVPAGISGLLLASALSEQFDPVLQACGVTAWGAIGLFLTLAYLRWTPAADPNC